MRSMLKGLIAFSLVWGCAAVLSLSLTSVARAADATPAAPPAPATEAAPVAAPEAPPAAAPEAPPAAAPEAPPAAAPETTPEPVEQDNQQDIDGTIKAIDAKAHTLTLTYMEADENDKAVQKTLDLKIEENAKVTIDDEDKQLTDVRVGDHALVTCTKDEKGPKTATEIAVMRMKNEQGVCKSVDAAAKKIVVAVTNVDEEGKATQQDVTFTVADDIPVTMDGKDATLKDVLPGDQVVVAYLEETPGQKALKAVDITRETVMSGKIKSVDAKAKKLELTLITEDDQGKEVKQDVTLDLGADVTVQINNEDSKLDQVKAGDDSWVTCTQAPGGPKLVTQIEVDRPQPNN